MSKCNDQGAKTVFDTSNEINTRGVRFVLGRNRNLADFETSLNNLKQNLAVKNKIIGVFCKIDILQNFSFVGTHTGVPLRKIFSRENIFDK